MLYKNTGIPVTKMLTPHLKLTKRDHFEFVDETESMIQVIKTSMNIPNIVRLENNIPSLTVEKVKSARKPLFKV